MALSNALFAGVSGLQANQALLDVVGNNLANANTTGFKSQRVTFEDLVYQTLSPGSAAGDQFGGTNPRQIGLGAAVSSIDSRFAQGAVQTTGRTLDLGIQGDGFFVVSNGQQDFYTRAGAFSVDDLGYVVNADGLRLQRTGTLGEATPAAPAFQVPGNADIRIPIGVGIPGTPTGTVNLRGNLSAGLATGDTFASGIQVYDTQGTEHLLTLTFTKTAANTFSVAAAVPGGTVSGSPVTGIAFNADGTLASPASITLGLSYPPGLPVPQTVTVVLGTPGQGDGLTQFGGDSTAAAISQDGSTAGSLINYSIDKDGTVQGLFSNGRKVPMAQVALARFANDGGLLREGDNLFSLGTGSGSPLVGTPGSGRLGTVQSGALEASNVDMSGEFTQLILAQRSYQMNAQSITVNNEVLQQLANIIR
ncbi:MAG: flagellar hook protein FlgE [Gemmataceae bacterium]|nr:flagellar hook protein FlgE [Gemmataceae bacterium]